MYTISITVPARHSSGVVSALSQVTGTPLDLLPEEPVTVVLNTKSIHTLDALKKWLDEADSLGYSVRLASGRYALDMGQFCRHCQADIGKGPGESLLPCSDPPSAKEWCPLVFVLEQAGQEVELNGAPRKRSRALSKASGLT